MDWKTIVDKYSLHIAGNRRDAEDLAQEAWVRLMRAMQQNKERAVTKAYLYRIVKHAWIDGLRGQKVSVPIEDYNAAAPDDSLFSRELLEQLAERLPPKMAVIVLLMDVFAFTAKETAGYVGMKEGAVQVTLGRARLKLKQLAQQPPGPVKNSARDTAMGPADMNALTDAFRRADAEGICRAYFGLAKEGIRLAGLKTDGRRLHFTFKDPDGNMFLVVSSSN
jgi:RNA polymerase sigma factor, sigma-70 family